MNEFSLSLGLFFLICSWWILLIVLIEIGDDLFVEMFVSKDVVVFYFSIKNQVWNKTTKIKCLKMYRYLVANTTQEFLSPHIWAAEFFLSFIEFNQIKNIN